MASKEHEIPPEIRKKLGAFDNALTDIENKLENYMKKSQIEINAELNALDKAKVDLVSAYTVNSLFWMYLNVCGINPKEHDIKQELDRIRSYMNRVKDIQEAEKAKETKLTVNVSGAKRVVKSALWEAAKKKIEKRDVGQDPTEKVTTDGEKEAGMGRPFQGEKRSFESNDGTAKKKRRKGRLFKTKISSSKQH